jgi:hypothetical protein
MGDSGSDFWLQVSSVRVMNHANYWIKQRIHLAWKLILLKPEPTNTLKSSFSIANLPGFKGVYVKSMSGLFMVM